MKRLALIALTLLFPLLLQTAASAAVVPSWTYTVDGAFVEWTNSRNDTNVPGDPNNGITGIGSKSLTYLFDGGVMLPAPVTTPGFSTLRWGDYTYSNRSGYVFHNGATTSSISIAPTVGGTLITGGAAVNGLVLSHSNKAIAGDSITLQSGTARAILQLIPQLPGATSLPVFSTTLDFKFFETPNTGSTQQDVFVLMNPEVTQETFHFYGIDYVMDFTKSFSPIPLAYRTLLGPPADAVGWLTSEGVTTTHQTLLSITALPTPEPASAVLMLMGLGGLGMMMRRARRTA